MKYYIQVLIVTIIVFFIGQFYHKNESNIIKQEKIIPTIETKYDIDDYVIGVLSCEMPASFNEEALKANAIAARTFAVFQIIKNNNYNPYESQEQCYITEEEQKEKWKDSYEQYHSKIEKIVNDTKGEIITYNNEPIKSYYFSTSNGQTENVQTVFKNDYSYLTSVSSDWDKSVSSYEKIVSYPIKDVLNKLNLEGSTIEIEILERNATKHVDKLKVNNTEFTGIEFRKKLSLRSTDFDIYHDDKNIFITTRGYGHGVGLSQYGANEMAKEGYNYIDILKHYYTGVEINMYKI